MKYIFRYLISAFVILIVVYFTAGFYVAYQILKIDPTCGAHQGSLPNSWSTKVDSHEYSIPAQQILRENFNYKKYYLNEWQNVYFQSRDSGIKINGWLFNYFPNRPIIIVTHGISPNGKCKSESNIIASFLVNRNFNVLTIDLRNYGESDTVSSYDDLGLESYKDILGAFDFLTQIGFKSKSIGLHGISLGASTSIFAANAEPQIQAIWADSPLAEFNMILKDEIARYGLAIEFGPAVSIAGRILTGIDPAELSPAKKLSNNQFYFFTHGDSDTRILTKHFNYFQEYTNDKDINAEFWLVKDAHHVDAMFKFPEIYSEKMEAFFNKVLK